MATPVGRTVYSPLGVSIPEGAALKVTPDPANIWSFHEELTIAGNATTSVDVLVDFDGNGLMDTENPSLRVLITDMQVTMRAGSGTGRGDPIPIIHLQDGAGVRWNLTPIPHAGTQFDVLGVTTATHLATPLALPVGSDLTLEISNTDPNSRSRVLAINLIGRVVNL